MITINPRRTNRLMDALTELWEASVRATHHFLTEEDIQILTPFVKRGLSDIETFIVEYDDKKPVAFMGVDAAKIEMLFVLPEYFGKGIGKELTTLAITQYVEIHLLYTKLNREQYRSFMMDNIRIHGMLPLGTS